MDIKNVLMNLLKIDPIILCINESIYCIKCSKYREFKNLKTSNILNKILVIFIIFDKWGSDDIKMFKEKESSDILIILCLINNVND